MTSKHTWPQFCAKTVINEVGPIADRIWGDEPKIFYSDPGCQSFVYEATQMYYEGKISKIVYRELVERRCWMAKIGHTLALKDIRGCMDFLEASEFFKKDLDVFEAVLTEEQKEYVRSL